MTYLGDGKFSIDYAISGTLDHAFLWPYNVDAELMFPFIAVELRANGTVRMKAPAFANDNKSTSSMGMPGMDGASSQLDGVFTPRHQCRDRRPEQRQRAVPRRWPQDDHRKATLADQGCAERGAAAGEVTFNPPPSIRGAWLGSAEEASASSDLRRRCRPTWNAPTGRDCPQQP